MSQIPIKTLPASLIRSDGLQIRAETNRAHIDDLVELIGDEGVWPANLPPCVVCHDGEHYYLADGHHRLMAAREAGCTEIPCEVRQGTRTDALWHALGSNADHGLKRTPADRRNAILTAYRLGPQLSNCEIARRCKVSESLVRYHLADSRITESPATSQIAKCEVDEQASGLVAGEDWLHDDEPAPTTNSAMPAPAIRTDAKGRQMNVSRIGKHRKADKPVRAPVAPHGTDELGIPIPSEASAKAFGSLDFFVELDGWAAQGAKLIDRLGKMPGAELLRAHYLKLRSSTSGGETIEHLYSHDLENLRREVQHWRPYAGICPQCQGDASPGCTICLGLPYITRAAFERCPEQLQQTVKAMVPQAVVA